MSAKVVYFAALAVALLYAAPLALGLLSASPTHNTFFLSKAEGNHTENCPVEKEHLCGEHTNQERNNGAILIVVVIFVTVLFEKAKHSLEHHAPECLRQVITALFGELTILGFVALLVSSISKQRFVTETSYRIFGHCDTEEELFESLHKHIFYIMISFVFIVTGLIVIFEREIIDRKKLEQDHKMLSSWKLYQAHGHHATHMPTPFSNTILTPLMYFVLRQEFIKPQHAHPCSGPVKVRAEFDFASYVNLRGGKVISELIDIKQWTWFFFAIWLIIVNYLTILDPVYQVVGQIIYAVLLYVMAFVVRGALINILVSLTPPMSGEGLDDLEHPQEEADFHKSFFDLVNTKVIHDSLSKSVRDHFHHKEDEEVLQPIRTFGCPRYALHQSPGHHSLFTFGHKFHAYVIQHLLLFIGVAVAHYFHITLPDILLEPCFTGFIQSSWYTSVIITLLTFIPLIAAVSMTYTAVMLYILVTSIEQMKCPFTINKVEAQMALEKSLLSFRKMYRNLGGDGPIAGDTFVESTTSEVVTEEKLRAEASAIFRCIDADESGTMTLDELQNAIEYSGIDISEHHVVNIMRFFDTDGSGMVEHDEFVALFCKVVCKMS